MNMLKNVMIAGASVASVAAVMAPNSSAATASTSTIPAYKCNASVSETYNHVTYMAPTYKDAQGHHNGCTIPSGSSGAVVTTMQKGLNVALSSLKIPGAQKITTFGYYGPVTTYDLKLFQKAMGINPTGKFDAITSSAMLSPLEIRD